MNNQIFAFKLTSGEELISFVLSEDNTNFLLENPRSLVINNRGELSLAPVLFSADPNKPISLQKTAVACFTKELREELASQFAQSVSKLVLPNKNILLG